MKEILLVFCGGGVGSVARYLVNLNITRMLGWTFPFGVMFINITGSCLMGLVAGYFLGRTDVLSQDMRLLLATGILGGYTTFSAYSWGWPVFILPVRSFCRFLVCFAVSGP
eukprot:gene17996-18232_t